MKEPLVSILIPAYNSEKWVADCIQSALAQTWPHKEIIVVDDGSTDSTLEIASQFASNELTVVSTENRGAAAARNHALELSKGDYIQWLDADDLLAPDKVERQVKLSQEIGDPRILISGPWGLLEYQTRHAEFTPSSLWGDYSPIEWLLRKMSEDVHMQTATWLTSRELTEAAGPWDVRLQSDDDGEYFCRVLLASNGTRFVPGAKVYYRNTPSLNRVSYIGNSDSKKESMLRSMKLHVQYVQSLEDSDRVRKTCLNYLQTWYVHFYPERPDLVAELQAVAAQLHGHLEAPRLGWKYAWLRPIFGWKFAKGVRRVLPQAKSIALTYFYRLKYELKKRGSVVDPTQTGNRCSK